jgi:glutamyl-tRNA reductase
MESTPTILQLRALVERQVRGEVEKTMGRLDGMDEQRRQGLEKMVAAITGKVVFPALHYLKTDRHRTGLPERIKAIRALYLLDTASGDQEES